MPTQVQFRIESLLSARLFLAPQVVGEHLYFVSNLSGRLSLYRMTNGGSMPQPLLPPHIALQNPELIGGYLYYVFPRRQQILVMIDQDGNEDYRPMVISTMGGFPEPLFSEALTDFHRMHLAKCDPEQDIIYLTADRRGQSRNAVFQVHLETGELTRLAESGWGLWPDGVNEDHSQVILSEGYTVGDNVLYLWEKERGTYRSLIGKPLDARDEGEQVPLLAIYDSHFTTSGPGLLFVTALFEDTMGLGYAFVDRPEEILPVTITGTVHEGVGELTGLEILRQNRYRISYNIDGVSWLYEGRFDEEARQMELEQVIVGQGPLENGVLESVYYDKVGGRFALSYSTATSPTQLYTAEGVKWGIVQHTQERLLGLPERLLAAGEDASFPSHDGLRISARLYLPADELGYEGARPLVYYVHGGPQSQERPDFAWFSMPLIQFLTLNGFAVFVPNARGSTGYGLQYTKQVDRDWGGQDRLDHVHAMMMLGMDERLDTSRAGVVGRSYGGYMTLTLAARHPELWSAAVDMFGPYDLLTFMERIPETWKPYFAVALGDPDRDRAFLVERSPRTYIKQLEAPLMVIQGKNDPRVIERESRDVVEQLRALGKEVDYLVFEDEGHDVLKFENRVRCYNAITNFFREHLRP